MNSYLVVREFEAKGLRLWAKGGGRCRSKVQAVSVRGCFCVPSVLKMDVAR